MGTTERHVTVDMIGRIEDPKTRDLTIAQLLKQLSNRVSRLENTQESCRVALRDDYKELDYIVRGADGKNGLRKKVNEQYEDTKEIKEKLDKLEDRFQAVMVKATTILSIIMVIGIPLVNRVLARILP